MKAFRYMIICIAACLLACLGHQAEAKEYWLLLDSSASLTPQQARLRNISANNFAETLLFFDRGTCQIGIIDFADRLRVLEPTHDLDNIQRFINGIGRSGRLTDIESVLNFFRRPSNVPRELYLFTDGKVDISPGQCANCPQDANDLASVQRITQELIPELKRQKPPPVIHTVGVGELVDKGFLESVASQTQGKSEQIGDIRTLEHALDSSRQVRTPLISLKRTDGMAGMSLDNDIVKGIKVSGPNDMRIEGPIGSTLSLRESNSAYPNRRNIFFDTVSGKYAIYTSSPKQVKVFSNIEIEIQAISPFGRRFAYQYEVLPFKVALTAVNGNEKVVQKLAQNEIKVDVIITGENGCNGSVRLKHNKGIDKGGLSWFEGAWWIDCNPSEFPAHIYYTYFIKDDSALDTSYPADPGMPLRIVKTDFDLGIESQPSEFLSKFKKGENQLWVSEKIKPRLIMPETLLPGIVRVRSTEYFLGDDTDTGPKISANEFSEIAPNDLNRNTLYAIVTCVSDNNQEIDLKVRKKLSISLPPFHIEPQSCGPFVPWIPAGFRIPFTTIQGLSDEIMVPFNCRINREKILLQGELTSVDINCDGQVITKLLNKGDTALSFPLRPDKGMSPGTYHFQIFFQSQNYLKTPLKYELRLEVLSPWKFITLLTAILALGIYLSLLLVHLVSGLFRKDVCLKSSDRGQDEWKFPLRYFPPGRWHNEKAGGKRLFRLGRSFFSNGFYVRNYIKTEAPVITCAQNCEKRSGNAIKILEKEDYFLFVIAYQESQKTVTIERQLQEG